MKKICALIAVAGLAGAANAQLINEFEPNPIGSDPSSQDFELTGTPGAAFSGWLLSAETDSTSAVGLIDRAAAVAGSFDLNGYLVVSTPDLENPSFSLFLTSAFTGTVGVTDILVDGYGFMGTVYDSINISDNPVDDASELVTPVGGTAMAAHSSNYEPERTWRDGTTGTWYSNFWNGDLLDSSASDVLANQNLFFDSDPFVYNYGTQNQSLVPAPASFALLGLGGLALRRRR